MKKHVCLLAALLAGGIASAQDHPKVETFFGYTYLRANSASNVPAFSANGGGGQLDINFNKVMGFVMDIGAVHNGNIGGNHIDSTFVNYLFGPRVYLHHSRVAPYLNFLMGGDRASTSTSVTGIPVVGQPIYDPNFPNNVPTGTAVGLRAVHAQTAFAFAFGGGLDIKLSRHVSFRPIGLDWMLTRFQNLRSAQDNNQHNLRYQTGLNFTFGGEAPLPPPAPAMRSCWDGTSVPVAAECPKRNMELRLSAAQTELCQGGTVTIGPAGQLPDSANYQWTIEGRLMSKEHTLEFGTSGREPGTYHIGLTTSAPDYNESTASTAITIRPYQAPSGSMTASPAEILVGEKADVTARFTPGQCGGNLGAPVYTASEGSISGTQFDSTEVQFDPGIATEQRKTVTIVAKAADEKGTATAQTEVVVKKPAAILATRLPDIVFPNGNARVNNCGKRVLLEELKTLMSGSPTGKVVLVGHVSEREAGTTGLDQQRALNAAAVISAGQGICYGFPSSQVLVGAAGATDNGIDYQSNFCGNTQEVAGSTVKESESDAKYRRVEVWFVPTGGVLPKSLQTYTDAASLSVSGLGCPK